MFGTILLSLLHPFTPPRHTTQNTRMERWEFDDIFKAMPNFSPSKSYGFGAGGLDDFGFGFDFTEPTAGVQAQLHDFEAALSKDGSSEPAASAFFIAAATPYTDTTGTTAGDQLRGALPPL